MTKIKLTNYLMCVFTTAVLTWGASSAAMADDMQALIDGAKAEGKVVSYGMPDDWVNFGSIFQAIEEKYGVEHIDTDMTAVEMVTKLLAEKDAPVADIGDIGQDFVGRLTENNLTMPFKPSSWDQLPDQFKDKDGLWSASYWGAIGFLIHTDKVKNAPQTWGDLLKPEYKDMVCSRNPKTSTYATMAVLSAAYANGGGEDNVQPGLDWFKQLRDGGNLRNGVVLNVAAVQKGECPISIVFDFDGFAKRDATGLPLQVIIPADGTMGLPFTQYVVAGAHNPNAAKLAIEYLHSDAGQLLLAQSYAHPTHPVKLPDDLVAKILPESAYAGKLRFATSLASFSTAVKNIVEGWTKIEGVQ